MRDIFSLSLDFLKRAKKDWTLKKLNASLIDCNEKNNG